MSLKIPVTNQDHIQGSDNASIELVEYGDYQCSYCGKAYPVVKKLQQELGDKLKFVFRNFPLTNIHPDALDAAIASEVAADLGKFWEMYDILYQNQGNLSDSDLITYANAIGLNVAEFEKLFPAHKYIEKIENSIEGGLKSGVNGTPTFYINGTRYDGDPYSAAAILDYINSIS